MTWEEFIKKLTLFIVNTDKINNGYKLENVDSYVGVYKDNPNDEIQFRKDNRMIKVNWKTCGEEVLSNDMSYEDMLERIKELEEKWID